ncbi:hypothetical protein ACFOET_09580 [Parapedobacter deserti]|uniref:DUF4957 domain-containing protein n=1 Tax=Parapedobacter deserti TaxID=1912957 RepID=A0ABV7JRC8_9SPHI
MKQLKIMKLAGRFFIVMMLLAACKEQDELFKEFRPDRMFMPAGEISAESGETEVKLTWKEALNTDAAPTYTVEIAKDSLFSEAALLTLQTDTTGIVLTDEQLEVREKYFARVRTNETVGIPASKWLHSNGFNIRGKQLFMPPNEQTDLKDTWVILKWRYDETVTQVVISEFESIEGPGRPVQHIDLDEEAVANATLTVGSLKPQTNYGAILMAGNTQVGDITFTTQEPSMFTIEITPDDDLKAVVEEASDQDVIGLHPGTYVATEAVTTLMKKQVSLVSVSGNPAETIIHTRGFDLRGDGAGIVLRDVTLDMLAVDGTYLIDLKGETSDGGAAHFSSITIAGCVVQRVGRALIRGSRAGNREHQIDFIRVENSILQDNDTDYALFEIQKLGMNQFEVINSTINRVSNNMLRYDTNIGQPAASIVFDQVTINAFGSNNRRPLFDINTPANIVVRNSVLANSKWASVRYPSPTVHNELLRSGNGATARFEYVNLHNLMNSAQPPDELSLPSSVEQQGVLRTSLPWGYGTDNFAFPAGSPLLTASGSAGPIGDPRWNP